MSRHHPSVCFTRVSSGEAPQQSTEHDLVTVETASLVAAHGSRIRFSPINSGAALYPNAPARGNHTFTRIVDYPFAERRRTGPVSAAIAELAVIGGVHDIATHTVAVQRWTGPRPR